MRTTFGGEKLAKLYIDRIVKLHGIPRRIMSDRGAQFTSSFWKSLHEALGTKLDFSSAYHPQTDGQTERVNQILEDMLRACVLTYGKDWEDSLPYAEFSYNNSYQASLKMSSYEALYGKKCRTLLMWSEVRDRIIEKPDFIAAAEDKVAEIRENLKAPSASTSGTTCTSRSPRFVELGDSKCEES
jgi:transposase InsO family protein